MEIITFLFTLFLLGALADLLVMILEEIGIRFYFPKSLEEKREIRRAFIKSFMKRR